MKLEAAKQLFEEIVDLCYQTENQQLIETVNQLYPEVESAQDILKVISSAEELQVNINEIEILPEEEEDVQEIQEKIEKLSE
jgi:predicted RND superfamily exporter protein